MAWSGVTDASIPRIGRTAAASTTASAIATATAATIATASTPSASTTAATPTTAASKGGVSEKGEGQEGNEEISEKTARRHDEPRYRFATKSDIETFLAPAGGEKLKVSSGMRGDRSQLSIMATYWG